MCHNDNGFREYGNVDPYNWRIVLRIRCGLYHSFEQSHSVHKAVRLPDDKSVMELD